MARHHARNRPVSWPDWFDPKGYPHFDQPIRDPDSVRPLVESPAAVARHAFLPFIHFEKFVRKYSRSEGRFVQKPRPLSYAGHTDVQIFRRYCQLLSAQYEAYLGRAGFGAAVIAYRRFTPPRCNIDFAGDVFRFIEGNAPCVAMAFDVKDFFESLDHKRLKRHWKGVLGVPELPADHHAVFKAVTRYTWVQRDDLYALFGITQEKLKDWRGPICTPAEFRSKVRTNKREEGLLRINERGRGVPQGSAISALLSNIYMTEVDRHMAALAAAHGGLYRRYSDDILLVCKPELRGLFEEELRGQTDAAGLTLHDDPRKKQVALYNRDAAGVSTTDHPLQYLGFTFDGRHVRVRSQTIARYIRKMRKAVRREKFLARAAAGRTGTFRVRRKRLYSRYTHLGTQNFISYARRAEAAFATSKIREQVKRHWPNLHAALVLE